MPNALTSNDYQPRFKCYMDANNIKPGDQHSLYKYIIWLSNLSAKFKRSINKNFYDTLSPQEQSEFTVFIKREIK